MSISFLTQAYLLFIYMGLNQKVLTPNLENKPSSLWDFCFQNHYKVSSDSSVKELICIRQIWLCEILRELCGWKYNYSS